MYPTVAIGERRYEVVRPWGELDGITLTGLSHVAVDSLGQLHIYKRSDPPIVILDRTGRRVATRAEGILHDGHGIFIDAKDRTFAVDRDWHQVHVFSAAGELERSLGDPTSPAHQAPFNHPADVAVAQSGELYVADGYGNSRIHQFTADGRHVRSWGRPGSGPGEFATPHGVWCLDDGRVLVADRENDRIQVFTSAGEYVEEWGDLYRPMDIYVDRAGLIFVTDQVPRLTVLSLHGEIIGRCKPAAGMPHGVWGDSTGDIYIAESAPGDQVTKLIRAA